MVSTMWTPPEDCSHRQPNDLFLPALSAVTLSLSSYGVTLSLFIHRVRFGALQVSGTHAIVSGTPRRRGL